MPVITEGLRACRWTTVDCARIIAPVAPLTPDKIRELKTAFQIPRNKCVEGLDIGYIVPGAMDILRRDMTGRGIDPVSFSLDKPLTLALPPCFESGFITASPTRRKGVFNGALELNSGLKVTYYTYPHEDNVHAVFYKLLGIAALPVPILERARKGIQTIVFRVLKNGFYNFDAVGFELLAPDGENSRVFSIDVAETTRRDYWPIRAQKCKDLYPASEVFFLLE